MSKDYWLINEDTYASLMMWISEKLKTSKFYFKKMIGNIAIAMKTKDLKARIVLSLHWFVWEHETAYSIWLSWPTRTQITSLLTTDWVKEKDITEIKNALIALTSPSNLTKDLETLARNNLARKCKMILLQESLSAYKRDPENISAHSIFTELSAYRFLLSYNYTNG